MGATEYLESIITQAREALEHAQAGGKRQNAFELMVSINDLHNAFNDLNTLNGYIAEELSE